VTAPLEIGGPAAPPRSNGELVFAEPWESRAFGLAVGLHEAGAFAWPRFQAALIVRIAAWEASPTANWSYYEHWLAALEDVLTDDGTLRTEDLVAVRRCSRAAPPATTTVTVTSTTTTRTPTPADPGRRLRNPGRRPHPRPRPTGR
jgi:nitrile hydratase accessory protein